MTEQEAIEVLKHLNFCGICTTGPCEECERKQAKEAALIALEEIQQYRNIEHKTTFEWIPCSERLPEEPDPELIDMDIFPEYIVMIEDAELPTVLEYFGHGKWYREGIYYSVVAWMPLPEPYILQEMTE